MKKSNFFIAVFSAVLMCALLAFPSYAAAACREALKVCAAVIIPNLFPFMVLSSLLIYCGGANAFGRFFAPIFSKIFHLSGACSAAVITGFLAGFPVGASVTADMVKRGDISKQEGERLLGFCNNAGAMFVIGSAAEMLKLTERGGLILFLSQFFSAVTVGVILGIGKKPGKHRLYTQSSDENLSECAVKAVRKSIRSILSVCGFILIFSVIINSFKASGISFLLQKAGFTSFDADCVLNGFAEMTAGISSAALLPYKPQIVLPLCSMLIGWSGLCVHMQVAAEISDSGIRMGKYFFGKMLQMIFAPVYTVILMRFAGGPVKTSAYLSSVSSKTGLFALSFFICACFCLILTIVFSIFSANKPSAKR